MLYVQLLKLPVDEVPFVEMACGWKFKDKFFKMNWYQVFNLLELMLENAKTFTHHQSDEPSISHALNLLLEREFSGYRVINGEVAPITNPEELKAIQDAIQKPSGFGMQGVSDQIANALRLLSKKPTPDFANSIKESISAVEGICKILTGKASGGLAEPLNSLAGPLEINPVMRDAFIKLYGFTCGKQGIRHPLMEDSNIGYSEAAFMLVGCSAFVNFIIEKARIKGKLPAQGKAKGTGKGPTRSAKTSP